MAMQPKAGDDLGGGGHLSGSATEAAWATRKVCPQPLG